jgi:DNA-binding transcriptional ArsR family regulator
MARENPHGDLVLTDPAAIRLVAEPTRYALLTHLQRHGGATADELAGRLELSTSSVERHLRVLAGHGLVRQATADSGGDSGAWEAPGRCLLVELPADAEGQDAARLLTTRMFLEAARTPQPWWTEDEPRLPVDWRQAGGLINAGLWLTTDELRALDDRIEELTARYAGRSARCARGRPTSPDPSATSCRSPTDQPACFSA